MKLNYFRCTQYTQHRTTIIKILINGKKKESHTHKVTTAAGNGKRQEFLRLEFPKKQNNKNKRQIQFLLAKSKKKSDERISIYLGTKIPSFWVLTLYVFFDIYFNRWKKLQKNTKKKLSKRIKRLTNHK